MQYPNVTSNGQTPLVVNVALNTNLANGYRLLNIDKIVDVENKYLEFILNFVEDSSESAQFEYQFEEEVGNLPSDSQVVIKFVKNENETIIPHQTSGINIERPIKESF